MTKKSVIITTSILISIVAIFTILFGVVFRVRKIEIKYDNNFCYKAQIGDILSDSKLSKGEGIFNVDRKQITDNIEKSYPYARVEGVNLSSFTSVEIKLSNREPLYYVVEEAVYYILDEDCKVLEITNDRTRASNYILLKDVFNIDGSVQAGDFLDSEYVDICNSLYKALYSNAILNLDNGDGGSEDRYLEREDMYEVIDGIEFNQVAEMNGKTDKLIITTSYGTKISIIEPQKDLGLKVNMAFSALRTLIEKDAEKGEDLATKGTITIRYSYDINNQATIKCEYYP